MNEIKNELEEIIKKLDMIRSTIDDEINIARINIIMNRIKELLDRMDQNE